uniref:Protein kinase domain-containing protein n=1 Tax=Strix occidentalis caurina TaxID=311401 RepID=A0A8D0FV42_STROC
MGVGRQGWVWGTRGKVGGLGIGFTGLGLGFLGLKMGFVGLGWVLGDQGWVSGCSSSRGSSPLCRATVVPGDDTSNKRCCHGNARTSSIVGGQVEVSGCHNTGEVVAIKILKKKRYHGRVVKKELKLLQALRGVDTEESHIVRFLESFADGACTYLVFELLEQNLRDFQKKNNFLPLPVRHIRTITVQLLAALLKLKELSIIHADLKPENIMLVDHARYPFHVKLVDFGSACILTEVRHVKQPYIQTRFYRAPEILLGLPFCEKVDVWSLGCVMAELHLGWPLYPGINEYDQVRYICSTLGLPRGELLCAGWKTCSFFQRVPHPTGSWQLRAPGEEMAKPVERRRYVFSSLDQLAAVHIHLASDSGQEALAEHCDLRGMVALLKTMLTWDSQERITPSAALEHPFISLQQVKSSFEATQYYQLCHKDLRASRKDASRCSGSSNPAQKPPAAAPGWCRPQGRWRCRHCWGSASGSPPAPIPWMSLRGDVGSGGHTHTPPKTRPQQQPAAIRTRGRRAHRYTPPSPSPCTCVVHPGVGDLGLRRAGRHHEQPLRGARRPAPSTHRTAARQHATLRPRYSPPPHCSGSGYRRRRQGI